jgi:hypothetical protein
LTKRTSAVGPTLNPSKRRHLAHFTDHSDPTGLYSYRNQPSRVLFALDKLVGALAPVIGYEALHGGAPISDGWHEGVTKDKVEKWEEKTREVMKGWEDEFWEVERKTERAGWLKVGGVKHQRFIADRRSDSGSKSPAGPTTETSYSTTSSCCTTTRWISTPRSARSPPSSPVAFPTRHTSTGSSTGSCPLRSRRPGLKSSVAPRRHARRG